MEAGKFQKHVLKLLTEINGFLCGQNEFLSHDNDISIQRMDSVEAVKETNDELINKVTYEKMVCLLVQIGGNTTREVTVYVMQH